MQIRLLSVAVALVALFWGSHVRAQNLPTTTEFGITVTQEQIINAISESQDFWPGVRKHIVSEKFPVADAAVRAQAAKVLKDVDSRLSQLMFSANQAQAQELVEFIANRLRKFSMYRDLRTTLADDALTCRLKERFEFGHRAICQLPEDKRAAAHVELLAEVKAEMVAARVGDDTLTKAMEKWERLGQNMDRMHRSAPGALMQEFENQLRAGDPKLKLLMASIVRAADWAVITQTESKPLKAADFVAAWESCLKYDQKQAQNGNKNPLK
jgi:hypothetical protein